MSANALCHKNVDEIGMSGRFCRKMYNSTMGTAIKPIHAHVGVKKFGQDMRSPKVLRNHITLAPLVDMMCHTLRIRRGILHAPHVARQPRPPPRIPQPSTLEIL